MKARGVTIEAGDRLRTEGHLGSVQTIEIRFRGDGDDPGSVAFLGMDPALGGPDVFPAPLFSDGLSFAKQVVDISVEKFINKDVVT